ncbi:hypothetical protein [Anaerosporobacter faecicola]|uniref:hypothetical protein n=1 Tax=Anaerosporobacter faecicola TaxID=2718714 RepID=UPI00143C3058|nr:hypothetical protein [Anaerosporobacter faecicola]
MDNYYSKVTQDKVDEYRQRFASIESEGDTRGRTRTVDKRADCEIIIDDTTIYEIDLNCYECLKKKMNKYSNFR